MEAEECQITGKLHREIRYLSPNVLHIVVFHEQFLRFAGMNIDGIVKV